MTVVTPVPSEPTGNIEGDNPQKDTKQDSEDPEKTKETEEEPKVTIPASLAVQAVIDPQITEVARLTCPPFPESRYLELKPSKSSAKARKFFFALDLYEIAPILPSLMGAVFRTIQFLGPENCALSIVEGRSTDGTYEILEKLSSEAKNIGFSYYLVKSDINPKEGSGDRIQELANLRNLALLPLLENRVAYTSDAIIVFPNDIVPCEEDILELLYQMKIQEADMVCPMDWLESGGLFYDVWVSRGINGDTFFEIPQNGAWQFASNLFWNDESSRRRLDAAQPFQVYACWNGMGVFKAQPLLEKNIRFRSNKEKEGECYMGEPTLLCKDFWAQGYGRIAVVPSVNVGYNVKASSIIKQLHGYAHEGISKAKASGLGELINWQKEPPGQVKCARVWELPSWVPPV
ncbi:hypothetical protein Egran_02718 [Elaphomyces granulatus]|uniref:Glycosyltransferase family 69 protein n=1 Tax=Elaphomyces granulatus TaxID=519963 RepID=A0A232LZD4_9EURO|nr:hypothetical protein Egran_02718 [Elaphomyces granulatus]